MRYVMEMMEKPQTVCTVCAVVTAVRLKVFIRIFFSRYRPSFDD